MKIDEAVRLMQDGAECICAFNDRKYRIRGCLQYYQESTDNWLDSDKSFALLVAKWKQFEEPKTIRDLVLDTIISPEQKAICFKQFNNTISIGEANCELVESLGDTIKANILLNLVEAKLI